MSDVFLGQILPLAFNFAPRGFASCAGNIMSIAQNTALFSLLGTQYGGNGTTTFALPDLRGRVPLGQASSPIGQAAGAEAVTLTDAQMPQHMHGAVGTSVAGSLRNPSGGLYGTATENLYTRAGASVPLSPDTVLPAGGNQPHTNLQPYLALNFCIALQGIFPSRQ
ncbi:MAG: phage tail protein [Lysobacter sp.]